MQERAVYLLCGCLCRIHKFGGKLKTYQRTGSHLFCGHWNGSPIEIGLTQILKAVPPREVYHYHDYHEYYIILQGKGMLNVEGRDVPLEANTVVMVEPTERHRITWVDPNEGIQWVIIKQHSVPNSKIIAPEGT